MQKKQHAIRIFSLSRGDDIDCADWDIADHTDDWDGVQDYSETNECIVAADTETIEVEDGEASCDHLYKLFAFGDEISEGQLSQLIKAVGVGYYDATVNNR